MCVFYEVTKHYLQVIFLSLRPLSKDILSIWLERFFLRTQDDETDRIQVGMATTNSIVNTSSRYNTTF